MSKLSNAYKKGVCGGLTYITDGGRKSALFLTEDGNLADASSNVVECNNNVASFKRDSNNHKVRSQSKLSRNMGFSGWRWNLRFQGIFQSDPRTAQTTDTTTTTTGSGGSQTNEPFTFIASRKTFDIDTQFWIDFWANSTFSIGPYFSIGASTVLDKNELQGEPVTNGSGNNTSGGTTSGNNTVATTSMSDNDIKKYYEGGALMNILLNRDLFAQSILAYGHYEALAGLYKGPKSCFLCDSQNRFIGKLRIFPFGLNRGFGRQIKMAPMFGVEVNAGRGPDHLKFFSGFAMRIKGISVGDGGAK
jgi:hypothetical protein